MSSCCICFTFHRNNQTGGFSEEGLTSRINRSTRQIECISNHLTSFAVIVSTQMVSTLSSNMLTDVCKNVTSTIDGLMSRSFMPRYLTFCKYF